MNRQAAAWFVIVAVSNTAAPPAPTEMTIIIIIKMIIIKMIIVKMKRNVIAYIGQNGLQAEKYHRKWLLSHEFVHSFII